MEMKNPAIEWHYSAKTYGRCVNSLGCKSATKMSCNPVGCQASADDTTPSLSLVADFFYACAEISNSKQE